MKYFLSVFVISFVHGQSVNTYADRVAKAAKDCDRNYDSGNEKMNTQYSEKLLGSIKIQAEKIHKEFDYDDCKDLVKTMKVDLQQCIEDLDWALKNELATNAKTGITQRQRENEYKNYVNNKIDHCQALLTEQYTCGKKHVLTDESVCVMNL